MGLKTPLFNKHESENARMVDFAGWEMPVQYGSITAEYQAVRERVGMFDVGHMGRFYLSGPGTTQGLSRLVISHIDNLEKGAIKYTHVCNQSGGIKDDVLVTCLDHDSFLVVVNASNREKLLDWFNSHLRNKDMLVDRTFETGMISIQGPDSCLVVEKIFNTDLKDMPYYHARVLPNDIVVSRTGYTGENGYEIIGTNQQIVDIWEKARTKEVVPCGLGARDILRLEMGFPLYGHELNEDISPLEAGLKWIVHFDKDEFIGKEALESLMATGVKRRRIGFQLMDRGIPREGCPLYDDERKIGVSTSGGYSPQLKKGIGLALVDKDWKQSGVLSVEVRGKKIAAEIKKPPFVPKRANT